MPPPEALSPEGGAQETGAAPWVPSREPLRISGWCALIPLVLLGASLAGATGFEEPRAEGYRRLGAAALMGTPAFLFLGGFALLIARRRGATASALWPRAALLVGALGVAVAYVAVVGDA